MTESIESTFEESTTSYPRKQPQRQEVPAYVKNDTSLKALQMDRTGSAGAPALPESPLARGKPAVAGVSNRHNKPHRPPMKLKVMQNGLGPRHGVNGLDDDESESGSDLGDYSFGNHESGLASDLGERPRLTTINGSGGGVGGYQSANNVVMGQRPERRSLIAIGGKREWTAIQVISYLFNIGFEMNAVNLDMHYA